MKHLFLCLTVLTSVILAISCKRNAPLSSSVSSFDLSARELAAMEQRGMTNASNALRLYQYYAFARSDLKKAMFWLRQSAELGDPVAQFNLASVVQEIGGRVEDYRKWMSLAAAQGDRDAIEALKKLDGEGMKPGWRAAPK
jgi:TPR repeat protein